MEHTMTDQWMEPGPVAVRVHTDCMAGAGFDAVDRHFIRRGKGLEFEMEVAWVAGALRLVAGQVVDVGCGIGALLGRLGVDRATGVDVHLAGLMEARRRFPAARLCHAPADRLPFGDGSVAAVTAQHLIEHLPDPAAAALEWFRVLEPGGVAAVLTPNRRFRDPSVFADPTHVCLFDRSELADLLAGTGFEILDLRTLGLPWFTGCRSLPGGWRLRRAVVERAAVLSGIPGLRWAGQTLCCAARKPKRPTGRTRADRSDPTRAGGRADR